MALPKINSPIFELTLPSTGASVKYRPFLVKEQKILLLAMESDDQKAVLTAIKQIVNNCAIDEIDSSKIPTFDLEYFFMRLRAKSIGETIELKLRHPTGTNSKGEDCDGITDATLDLLEIEIKKSHTTPNATKYVNPAPKKNKVGVKNNNKKETFFSFLEKTGNK